MTYDELIKHIPISREAYEKLRLYHDLLLKWQARVNLIAPSTTGDIWERHILDSARLLQYINPLPEGESDEREIDKDASAAARASLERRFIAKPAGFAGNNQNISIADIGSGAGFPGLVLVICGAGEVTLIESDRKKCEFLREAARITATPVTVLNERAEAVKDKTFDILVSRATAPLETLFAWAVPLMHTHSFCLFHKGENWATEIDAARLRWVVDIEALPSKPGATGCIIKATNLSERAAAGNGGGIKP